MLPFFFTKIWNKDFFYECWVKYKHIIELCELVTFKDAFCLTPPHRNSQGHECAYICVCILIYMILYIYTWYIQNSNSAIHFPSNLLWTHVICYNILYVCLAISFNINSCHKILLNHSMEACDFWILLSALIHHILGRYLLLTDLVNLGAYKLNE